MAVSIGASCDQKRIHAEFGALFHTGNGRSSMAWERRKRDHNVMFAVNYTDGRIAYITIAPRKLEAGDQMARTVARERQESGEIPAGDITAVKRVR
jgi:hypothetical protein